MAPFENGDHFSLIHGPEVRAADRQCDRFVCGSVDGIGKREVRPRNLRIIESKKNE